MFSRQQGKHSCLISNSQDYHFLDGWESTPKYKLYWILHTWMRNGPIFLAHMSHIKMTLVVNVCCINKLGRIKRTQLPAPEWLQPWGAARRATGRDLTSFPAWRRRTELWWESSADMWPAGFTDKEWKSTVFLCSFSEHLSDQNMS